MNSVWSYFLKDVDTFCNYINNHIGYIVRSEISYQFFHKFDMLTYNWNEDIFDKARMNVVLVGRVSEHCKVYESFKEAELGDSDNFLNAYKFLHKEVEKDGC